MGTQNVAVHVGLASGLSLWMTEPKPDKREQRIHSKSSHLGHVNELSS
jgi:hypothetical protein